MNRITGSYLGVTPLFFVRWRHHRRRNIALANCHSVSLETCSELDVRGADKYSTTKVFVSKFCRLCFSLKAYNWIFIYCIYFLRHIFLNISFFIIISAWIKSKINCESEQAYKMYLYSYIMIEGVGSRKLVDLYKQHRNCIEKEINIYLMLLR